MKVLFFILIANGHQSLLNDLFEASSTESFIKLIKLTASASSILISSPRLSFNWHYNGEFYLAKSKIREFLERHDFEIMTRSMGNHAIDDCIYGRKPRI